MLSPSRPFAASVVGGRQHGVGWPLAGAEDLDLPHRVCSRARQHRHGPFEEQVSRARAPGNAPQVAGGL